MALKNHPLRIPLTEELHSRPFPVVSAPAEISYLAVRLSSAKIKAIQELAEILGLPKPENAGHYYATNDKVSLKWEQHTEFQAFTLIEYGKPKRFDQNWLDGLRGEIMTAAQIHMPKAMTQKQAQNYVVQNMAGAEFEALAVTAVLDLDAVLASDFKISKDDVVQMQVLPIGQVGQHRLGRIVQRLLEIETYRAMSMLTLPVARDVFSKINTLDAELADLVNEISKSTEGRRKILDRLLSLSAELETLNAEHSYRFSAGKAYSTIVHNRIEILREERFQGRQTFREFFMRRFQPAMNTCVAAEQRLKEVTARAARALEMLSTRATLLATEQNKDVLAAMDRRSALQLRLQETVEGLSVVAISYYAVNLLGYLGAPFAEHMGFQKPDIKGWLVIPVALLVWFGVRSVKRKFFKSTPE